MKRLRIIGDILLKSLFILLLLSLCWTSAYFVTDWCFQRWGWHSSMLLRQLSISILGFIFFGVFISIVSPFVRKKQMAIFYEMTGALKRISKGDFQVNLNKFEGRNDSPLGQLAYSISDMAVNLKAMEEMRQEFISNVSHEIQSPLTSISGFAQAMIDEELPRDKQIQYLDIINAESTRLSKLSDDLLRLASLDSEHPAFQPETYRLDKQLQLQILAFEPQWLDKEIELEVNLAELNLNADPSLLSQVWVNLIHNAVKFTPSGGTITVTLERHDHQAIVRVADTGFGMSEEDQKRIFERFYKADKSRTRSAGGSGLGLSIVQKIVEMHQGSISVSSKPGEGAAFTVILPIGSD